MILLKYTTLPITKAARNILNTLPIATAAVIAFNRPKSKDIIEVYHITYHNGGALYRVIKKSLCT
jgi:hypothetical protein